LVLASSNALPELTAISKNEAEPWQMRAVAGIVAERIQRGPELGALITCDWRKDPEYSADWEVSRAGPSLFLAPLVTKRCSQKALWWYCMEMVWKETEEHSGKALMREEFWRGACRSACRQSPVYDLILKVTEDRIRKDSGFRRWETRGDLEFLEKSQTNSVLPFLMEILPCVPVTDERNREWYVREWLGTLAQPQDAALVEEYYQKTGATVPELLRPQLQSLKDRLGQGNPSRK
jgi:hypothetical protein